MLLIACRSVPRRWLGALLLYGRYEPHARRFALWAAQGLDPITLGRRNVPARGPLIVAPAHVTGDDFSILSAAIPRKLQVIIDASMDGLPFFSTSLALRGSFVLHDVSPGLPQGIGIDESYVAALHSAAQSVRAGNALVIFPQGVRRTVGGGVARIAARAQAPILLVTTYFQLMPRALPRMLVVLHRPTLPPADDPRSRRVLRKRVERRLTALGALRPDASTAVLAECLLDDARLWQRRNRLQPIKLRARLARLARRRPDLIRRQARLARMVLRSTRPLHCSVHDLRHAPGLRHLVAVILLAGPSLAGLALNGPPWILLRRRTRGIEDRLKRHTARMVGGILLSLPWGIVLAIAGAVLLGPPGLALPPIALVGLAALGAMRRVRPRLRCLLHVRMHHKRPRLRLALATLDTFGQTLLHDPAGLDEARHGRKR